MIVVSDTTPLISMMKTGHLELIQKLFGEVQIPEAVYRELISNDRYPNESRQIMECPFIHRVKVSDERAVDLLRRSTGLDIGESEAIILSDTIKATYLLMDEIKGRKIAQQMGMHIMGTIGMLMVALDDGILDKEELLACIDSLRHNSRHISEYLYNQLIEKIKN